MFQELKIIGNLGADPEMRYTIEGKPVTNFDMATNRKYTTADGKKVTETTWFRITAWGRNAETTNQYLKKGSKVLVEGRLISNAKGHPNVFALKDGTAAASFEINAGLILFLDNAPATQNEENGKVMYKQPAQEENQPAPQAPVEVDNTEDIPF